MRDNDNVINASAVFDEIREGEKVRTEIKTGAKPRMIDIDMFFERLKDAERESPKRTGVEAEARAVITVTIRTLCEMEWVRQTGRTQDFQRAVMEVMRGRTEGET